MAIDSRDVRPVDSGIRYMGADTSSGCVVRFWLSKESRGWEYLIEKAWLNKVAALAVRGGGIAFNWCKHNAMETYGPYDSEWRLIDADSN